LLLGILREGDGMAVQILQYFGINLDELKRTIEKAVVNPDANVSKKAENIPLVKQAERALKITYLEAKLYNSDLIGTEHLLLAILKDEDNVVTKSFEKRGINYEVIKEELKTMISNTDEKIIKPKDSLPEDPADDMEEGRGIGRGAKKIPRFKIKNTCAG
jgi:ATP-dependent Clp protease ATP-binding subunit ClpC